MRRNTTAAMPAQVHHAENDRSQRPAARGPSYLRIRTVTGSAFHVLTGAVAGRCQNWSAGTPGMVANPV